MNRFLHLFIPILFLSIGIWHDLTAQEAPVCYDFEDFAENIVFGASTGLEPGAVVLDDNGLRVSLQKFDQGANAAPLFGDVAVLVNSPGTAVDPNLINGKHLLMEEISARFEFDRAGTAVNKVCFNYWNTGGTLNLSVNDQALSFTGNLGELDGQEIAPGVVVRVASLDLNAVSAGTVCLEGRVQSLLFGGQRVLLDDLCVRVEEVCSLSNLVVKPLPCSEDGQFYVELSFDAVNPGNEGFTVRGNGVTYGSFSYEREVVHIGPLPGDGEQFFEFVVIDNENPDCRASVELGRVDCAAECPLEAVRAYVQNCLPTYERQLVIDLDYRLPLRSEYFILYLNGEFYGSYSYLDVPLVLDDFPVADQLEVTVCGNDGRQCCLRAQVEYRQCPDQQCMDFNELAPGTVWGRDGGHQPGDVVYEKEGVQASVEKFQYLNGTSDFWNVTVMENIFDGNFTSFEGSELFISNINLNFDFAALDREVNTVCFDFIDGGGEENLAVNGEPIKVLRSLEELDGQEVAPGVFLSITPTTNSTLSAGRLCLEGNIQSLTIGGQEFAFDNLCLILGGPRDCSISGLEVRPLPCTPNGVYYAEMKFAAETTASDHFVVRVDGEEFGKFPYADGFPKLGPFAGDPYVRHLIEVYDSERPECGDRFLLEPVRCPSGCGIGNLQAKVKSCNEDGSYNIWINFDSQNSLQNGFDLYLEGQYYGFYEYDRLPLLIDGFVPVTDGLEFEVRVCENDREDCCLSKMVRLECPENCRIYDLKVEATPCTDDGQYYVELDFKYENVSEDFALWINGNEASFHSYDELPLKLGPYRAPLEQALEFKVKDQGSEGCYAEARLGPVYCDCRIFNLEKEIVCHPEEGTYDLYLKFEYANVASDGFRVKANGQEFGPFSYEELPVKLEGIPWTEQAYHELIVCDLGSENACCAEMRYQVECQDPLCKIGELWTEVSECDENGEYYIKLDFEHENTSGKFWVTTNVIRRAFGPYAYDELPVRIGPLPTVAGLDVAITVQDEEWQHCRRRQSLGEIICEPPCAIYDVELGEAVCDPVAPYRSVQAKLDFRYEGTGEYFFVATENGWSKKYKYADLPVLVEDIPVPAGQDWIVLRVCDAETEGCCVEAKLWASCLNPCEIGDLKTEVVACEDGRFDLKLNFDHARTSGKFWVTASSSDRRFGPFEYEALPIVVENIPQTATGEVLIVVRDAEIENCVNRKQIQVVCPPECQLYDLRHSEVVCNPEDNTFSVKIDFEVEGPHSDYYIIRLENGRQARFRYDELPLVLENIPYPTGTNLFRFKICDARVDGCCLNGAIEIPCQLAPCEIGELQLGPTECNSDGQFMVDLKFRHARTGERFALYVNDDLVGRFRYAEMPFRVGPYPGDGQTALHFRVVDESGECASEGRLEPVDCTGECTIRQVIVEPQDCEEGLYMVDLEVRASNPGPLGYYVFADGQLFGPYSYSEPYITLGPFPGDGTTVVDMLVLDISDPSCFGYVEVGPIACDEECVVEAIDLEVQPCTEQGAFMLDIAVDVDHPGDRGFRVIINGESYGEDFSYESEVVTIGPLLGDGETIYEVAVVDNAHPACVKVRRLGPVFCPSAEVWPGDANSDNVVQHFDLLNIGLAYNVQGLPRTESTDAALWQPVAARPWTQNFANGLNYKHADCNGDGVVNESDVDVIRRNYGLSHGEQRAMADLPATDTDPPIFAEVPQPGTLADGDEFHIPINLGEMAAPVEDIYGIGFSLFFDPNFIDATSLRIEYPASWLGEEGVNMITLDSIFEDGRIDIAMTRIDLNEVSGFGQVAVLHGIIDDIAGIYESEIRVEHVLAIDRAQSHLYIRLGSSSLRIGAETGTSSEEVGARIQVYPNPTHEWVNIRNAYDLPIEAIEVFNASGQRVLEQEAETNRISMSDLQNGVYFIRLKVGGVVVHKRVVKN